MMICKFALNQSFNQTLKNTNSPTIKKFPTRSTLIGGTHIYIMNTLNLKSTLKSFISNTYLHTLVGFYFIQPHSNLEIFDTCPL
jgi:hypothetical protein